MRGYVEVDFAGTRREAFVFVKKYNVGKTGRARLSLSGERRELPIIHFCFMAESEKERAEKEFERLGWDKESQSARMAEVAYLKRRPAHVHTFVEQEGEPARDVCTSCGAVRY